MMVKYGEVGLAALSCKKRMMVFSSQNEGSSSINHVEWQLAGKKPHLMVNDAQPTVGVILPNPGAPDDSSVWGIQPGRTSSPQCEDGHHPSLNTALSNTRYHARNQTETETVPNRSYERIKPQFS